MGGILLRVWAQNPAHEIDGRVVMMGPPNRGSELVDKMGDLAPFRWVNGPSGMQLGTGPDSTPNTLPSADFIVGIIAGRHSINPAYSAMIPGPDDGKVSVASTHVAGETAHLTLPVTHTYMMSNPRVMAHTLSFLQTGAFLPGLTYGEALGIVID